MASRLVHFEICGPDGKALKGFYGDLFGWGFDASEGFGDYYMTDGEETGLGGAVGQGSPEGYDLPNYVALYVAVPDIDAHLARIGAAGGSTVVSKTVIPGMVTYAMFRDPAGNLMGLVEDSGS